MNFILKPNFKTAGPVFGSKIKLLGKALESLEASTAVAALEAGESLSVDVDGEQLDIVKDYVIVSISAKEGFTVTMENNLFVILDTTLTRELIDEGLARELVSKVQQMRKSNDFEMMDRIRIYFDGDDQVTSAIQSYQEYIKVETLAESIEKTPSTADLTKVNLNDHDTGVRVERI